MRIDGDSDIEGLAVGKQPQQWIGDGTGTERDPVLRKVGSRERARKMEGGHADERLGGM